MSKEKLEVIKETDLQNNCPECFNQALMLTFYQKHICGKLFNRVTGEVTHQIKCKKCGSDIYPVKWTDDIERMFGYYQKMVTPDKASIKFTGLFYALILSLIVIVGAGVYLFKEGIIRVLP